MGKLEIVYLPVSTLRPRDRNPRTHSRKQIEQIVRSMQKFGYTTPMLVDENNGVIAGHGRLEAAKTLGLTEVPVVRLSEMSDADIRAYVIADNRLAENAGWDRELLAIEFDYLSTLDADIDLTITGFEAPEIECLIAEIGENSAGKDDQTPSPPTEPPTTQIGDVWLIGRHRLICGDATLPSTYAQLLRGAKAQMIFADPPYNVRIDGHVCGAGAVKHREFAMASGEMSSVQFVTFLTTVFRHLSDHAADGAIHFQCMDWRHLKEILAAGEASYTELKNICVWAKTNGGLGSLYRSQHEMILVFKSGTAAHINNVELGKHGRFRTNLWTYAGVNTWGGERARLVDHPTVKPVALVRDAILDCSRRGDIVLDPFCGSGTTLLAAERTHRVGLGIELDPIYCDVIVRRLQEVLCLAAVLEQTGKTFSEVRSTRMQPVSGLDV